MDEREITLSLLGEMLAKVARPHHADDELPSEVRRKLGLLGLPDVEFATREELIAGLWARKRSVLMAMEPDWGGPGITPPSAA
jgi:hypothetical protein